jgi:hypothetical protein
MDADGRLAALCRQLNDEPLLHVSLGSKELFHSNLIGWMCERFPDESVRVLSRWLRPAEQPVASVQREYKHLDLVARFPGFAPVVVENKMFALPDVVQLRRHLDGPVKAIVPQPTLVLLSLTDPGWSDGRLEVDGKTWVHASWHVLAQRLRTQFAGRSDFGAQILTHEAHLIHLLYRAIDQVSVKSDNELFLLPISTTNALRGVRIADAVGKIRGHQVMRRILDQYQTRGISPTWTEVDLTNGTPLMSAYWEKDEVGNAVGWQCQGNQWRLAMILRSMAGRGDGPGGARAAYAASQSGWFEFEPLCEILEARDKDLRPKGGKTPPDGFNKYDPDFVYRYRRLPAPIPVGRIIDLAVAYGEFAATWTFDPPPPQL